MQLNIMPTTMTPPITDPTAAIVKYWSDKISDVDTVVMETRDEVVLTLAPAKEKGLGTRLIRRMVYIAIAKR